MNRRLLLLSSNHAPVAAALQQYCSLHFFQSHQVECVAFSHPVDLFEALDEIKPEHLRDAMMIFHITEEDESMWDVDKMKDEQGLAAQLVLSYPEVYFVFVGSPRVINTQQLKLVGLSPNSFQYHLLSSSNLHQLFELMKIHAQGFRTIFDATGLRSHLMQDLLSEGGDERASVYVSLSKGRKERSVACADDEPAFVYLNSYVAYKAGFRTWLLSTETEFNRTLPIKNQPKISNQYVTDPDRFAVVLSDWDLLFPDHKGAPAKTSLLMNVDLQANDKLIIVTSFRKADEKDTWESYPSFVHLRVPKPYGGIFDLLSKHGNKNPLKEKYDDSRKGVNSATTPINLTLSPHSTPYARSTIAARLLSRAKVIRAAEAQDTESWIQMALLASEAKEIFGGLSRTSAYEAIALQNEAEVNAEVSFTGTSANIEVKKRLEILEEEGQIVQRRSVQEGRKDWRETNDSHYNFLLRTTNKLRLHFTAHEQINAAEECLRKFAWYQHCLSWLWFISVVDRRINLRLVEGLSWLTFGYPEFATRTGTSVRRLFLLSLGWIVFFAGCYYGMFKSHPLSSSQSNAEVVKLASWHSAFTFVELQPGLSEVENDFLRGEYLRNLQRPWPGRFGWKTQYRIVLFLELAVAYLHLGLLVSLLYRRITKRSP